MTNFTVKDPYIEVTSMCNLRCIHCYNSSGVVKPDEIGLDEIITLIQELREMNVKQVSISGGEALLRKDIHKILKGCRENGLSTMLVTNGMLIDELTAQHLVGLVDKIQISIEGSEEIHDVIRGNGTYKKILLGLNCLREVNLCNKTKIKMTISSLNVKDVENVINFALTQKLQGVSFSFLRNEGRARSNDIIPLQAYELIKVNEKIRYFKNKYTSLEIGDLGLDGGNCDLLLDNPIFIPRIASNGDVFLCQGFVNNETSVGNIRMGGLKKALQSDKTCIQLVKLKERQRTLSSCIYCPWKGPICKGGCAANALSNNGTIMSTDNICNIRTYYWSKKLIKNKKR